MCPANEIRTIIAGTTAIWRRFILNKAIIIIILLAKSLTPCWETSLPRIASDVLVHPHHIHQLDVQVDCLGRCPSKEHENKVVQESRDQATQPGDGGDVSSNEEEEVETEESKAEVEDDLPMDHGESYEGSWERVNIEVEGIYK